MIFCTAGHVDHGKTALVRALTGVDTDRLAEERRRGLTIELGFAPLELPGVGRVSLVDVPGHAQFIPTMLSGCGGLDGALFTVAADEGPMPQTAEHLDILSLLGLERGVVALTRADLASPAARAEVEARTRALTAGTFLEGAPRIFVSAVTGEGLEALRAALAAMARQAPPPPEGSPRLHVDRVFSVDGSGTVVTGTLTGGPLRRGDRVQLYPGGQTARVRGLQCHGVPAEALPAGVRAAVNLAGVRLRDVGRGDTLAAPGALALTDRTDVSLRVLPDAPFPVHTGSQLHFHHGARALVCRCILLGQDVLRPGEAGWAQLRFTQPAAAAPGDRFVARFFSPLATVGGGVLVDLGGRGEGLLLEAHADTLGGMVAEIKGTGRLRLTALGGMRPENGEAENVRVYTRSGRVIEGTFQLCNASIHVNGQYGDTKRTFDSCEVVLDEDVKSADDTRALGVEVGDVVCFEPRTRITGSGYIKSRFLDDKLSVGILLGLAKFMKDKDLTPRRRVYAHVTVYEEVGHGGAASVPQGVTEAISVDMGCVGDGLRCTERQVSICAKDSGGPYSYEVVGRLMDAARREKADYAVDVYPHYGSDVEATLSAGNDLRHGLIGAGVYASHGYERSHIDGVWNTLKVLKGYLEI